MLEEVIERRLQINGSKNIQHDYPKVYENKRQCFDIQVATVQDSRKKHAHKSAPKFESLSWLSTQIMKI